MQHFVALTFEDEVVSTGTPLLFALSIMVVPVFLNIHIILN